MYPLFFFEKVSFESLSYKCVLAFALQKHFICHSFHQNRFAKQSRNIFAKKLAGVRKLANQKKKNKILLSDS